MALSNRALIRVPPDGAGKAIYAKHLRYLEYGSAVDPSPFAVNDVVVGSASLIEGRVVYVLPASATTGSLVVAFADLDAIDGNFSVGENLQVDGVARAVLVSQEDFYASKTEVIGSNNPAHGQHVDIAGAASVRFVEGAPSFDPYGDQKVANPFPIGTYTHRYNEGDLDWGSIIGGVGSVTYEQARGSMLLTTTGVAGDSVIRRTNRYHRFDPGLGITLNISISLGDAGKAGLKREWGMLCDSNGAFFQLDGTQLGVGHRAGTNGVLDEVIPREDWNRDRLDGSGPSRMVLDLTKINIFFIEYQFMGSGRINFGVYGPEGRVVCHVDDHNNVDIDPMFAYGSLPVSVVQVDAGAGSTSEMRLYQAAVESEGILSFDADQHAHVSPLVDVAGSSGWNYVASFRLAALYEGLDNRRYFVPNRLDLISHDPVDSSKPVPVEFAIFFHDGSLFGTAPDWAETPPARSSVEIDTAATINDAAIPFVLKPAAYLANGLTVVDLTDMFDPYTQNMTRNADGTSPVLTTAVRTLMPTEAAHAVMNVSWHEIDA